jgi:hypothetical protein
MIKTIRHIDIEIDKLTNSIENSISGDVFDTDIIRFKKNDKSYIKTNWLFDWKKELNDSSKMVYKLVIVNNPKIIQGLICLSDNHDHIFMHLIENAKFNKGKNKLYIGVAGNLVAFACKESFSKGYDGIVSFIAKSKLIKHYEDTLGAKIFHENQMYIDTSESIKLVNRYFKNS